MKGLILAGGHGTRLRPLTFTLAKQLIPIANKPILFYVIEDLKNSGITDIGIVVGHTQERIKNIKDAVGDGSKFGVKITYIEQDAPRGLAHGVWISKDFLGLEPFVLYLGDNLIKGGIKKYAQEFESGDYDLGEFFVHYKNPEKYGVPVFEGTKLIGVIEKPKTKPDTDLVQSGIYFFRSQVFDIIKTLKPSGRNELEITDAIDKMIRGGYKVKYWIADNQWWKDTGTPEDILEANRFILDEIRTRVNGSISKEAKIKGEIVLGENSKIEAGAKIIGPVIIGKNCIIGPGSVIGPYVSIGDNSQINSKIESSIIMKNSVIDSGNLIKNSLIGENTRITKGKDFTALVIGDGCQVSL